MCYSILVKRDMDYLAKRYGAIALRGQSEAYEDLTKKNPKQFPASSPRIYPGHYGPVIFGSDHQLQSELMRYGTYPPDTVRNIHKYSAFNARSDNLRSHFWSNAFMCHHGFVVLDAFYEWVAVKDLLKAGVVRLEEVDLEFARQSEERKARILKDGKPYKPTPTELKPSIERQIIIQFKPEDESDLIVPVIFSRTNISTENEVVNAGFAVITDEPSPEIRAAGHDRSPIILQSGAEREWCRIDGKKPENFEHLLSARRRVIFRHGLAKAV